MEHIIKPVSPAATLKLKDALLIRALDLLAAGLGLLLLSPLFLLISLAIKLSSPGPVFYRAERVGCGGRLFKLFKFRTMVVDAAHQGPGLTLRDDPRITRLGRWLRQTKLDELPQLLNVLQGQMSLVGPRPEDPRYVAGYTPEQRRLLAVRPGLTSPASFYYRAEASLLDGPDWEEIYRRQILPDKLALELAYLQQRSLGRDLGLILKTVATLLLAEPSLRLVLALRNRHFLALDFLALSLIPLLALSLRLDGLDWWPRLGPALALYTLLTLLVTLPLFYALGLYDRYWRYASVSDLTRVLLAVTVATAVVAGLVAGLHASLEPLGLAMFRSVPLVGGLLTGLVVAGSRFGVRGLYHWHHSQGRVGGRRVLVVGAGEAGSLVVREMRANPQLGLEPVAFVDDDPAKQGSRIQSLPVLGGCADLPRLIRQQQIERLIVAMPSVPLARLKQIQAMCGQTGLPTDQLPGMYELLAGHKSISPLPQVDCQRLLRRAPLEVEQSDIAPAVAGATVLVTGAGGSIGRELCRQLAPLRPGQLVLLGRGENSIFEANLELRLHWPELATRPIIADVREPQRLASLVGQLRPRLIFHAAAHKHVPFMEENIKEAVMNNVWGTYSVLQAAERAGVERFILISSDKAVNPTSIMGATKRLAELLVNAAAQRTGRPYLAVRFGNVLGSRGSVIPLFQQQIAAGGPVTVTHPDMQRYFMTIPEAVALVLQAAALGQGQEIFVLDMGQPLRIDDLARDLIRLAGYEPGRDIPIVYSGIRPGEKVYEELFLAGEAYQRTGHPQIFKASQAGAAEIAAAEQMVLALVQLARRAYSPAANEALRHMLPKVCFYVDQYGGFKPPPAPAAAQNGRQSEGRQRLPGRSPHPLARNSAEGAGG